MPGITMCGRCGASLQLNQAAVSVHPPRASSRQKWFRRWFPSTNAVRENLGTFGTALAQEITQNEEPPQWPVVWRMIVPGWAHQYSGYSIRAKVFFFSYLALLGLGLLLMGSIGGSLFLGLAISCHASSILDLVIRRHHGTGERVFLGLLTFSVLFFLIYLPGWMLVRRVAMPIPVNVDAPPLAYGDVLLAQSVFGPGIGDVVAYEIPPARVAGRIQLGAAYIDFRGQRVDRILAGPGQTVEIKNGEILVDGEPSPHQPLNPERFFTMQELTVPSGQWFILPSTDPYANQVGEELPRLCLVGRRRVEGTVWLRTQPLSRMGRVKSLSKE